MTILQALDRYYDRLADRREVVSPGYSVHPIGFVITIAPDGAIVDVVLWRDASGKKPRTERVPKWFDRSGNGSTPYFLWDNTAYALGVSTKIQPKPRAITPPSWLSISVNCDKKPTRVWSPFAGSLRPGHPISFFRRASIKACSPGMSPFDWTANDSLFTSERPRAC